MEELIPKERPSQTFDDHGRLLIDGSLLEGVIVKSLVGVQSVFWKCSVLLFLDLEILLAKLVHLGIRDSLSNWFRSFLIGRSQRVVVEGMTSSPTRVRSGVPQGTVLINDISKGLTTDTSKDAQILRLDLNKL